MYCLYNANIPSFQWHRMDERNILNVEKSSCSMWELWESTYYEPMKYIQSLTGRRWDYMYTIFNDTHLYCGKHITKQDIYRVIPIHTLEKSTNLLFLLIFWIFDMIWMILYFVKAYPYSYPCRTYVLIFLLYSELRWNSIRSFLQWQCIVIIVNIRFRWQEQPQVSFRAELAITCAIDMNNTRIASISKWSYSRPTALECICCVLITLCRRL